MEILIGIMILFGGVGYVANKDAESRNATIVGKEIRFIQETRETTYKAETLGGWRKVQ
jgi:hypothetical protein